MVLPLPNSTTYSNPGCTVQKREPNTQRVPPEREVHSVHLVTGRTRLQKGDFGYAFVTSESLF